MAGIFVPKLLKSDNPSSSYKQWCRGWFFWDTVYITKARKHGEYFYT